MRRQSTQYTQANRERAELRQLARERNARKAARFTLSPFVELYRETKARRMNRDESKFTEARAILDARQNA